MADRQARRRLFLALWPDDATRGKIAGVQQSLARNDRLKQARAVPVANLHITTHFLGAVTEDLQAQLETLLSGVQARTSTLVIDRWGYFPRPKVFWLGASRTPGPLADLVEQTQACVQACLEDYRPNRFVPHLTLFRKARHPLEVDDFEPIEWTIDRHALVESVTLPEGPVYTVLREWVLD